MRLNLYGSTMSTGLQLCSVMRQVVRLLGDLGERYGTEHVYHNLRTPADAIKLLCINKPKLQEELIHAHEHGIGYRLIQAGTDLGYEDLKLPLGSKDLVLTPVVAGSGGGSTTQILIGVGLIAASFAFPGAGLFGATSFFGASAVAGGVLTGIGTALSAVGASLILMGVSNMISPQPTVGNLSGSKGQIGEGENGSTDGPQSVTSGASDIQSYMYTGATNTVGTGATIPVVYGEVLAGAHLLSAYVEVADESDPLNTAIRDPGPDTMTVGGEELSGLTYANGFRYREWDDDDLVGGPDPEDREVLTLGDGNSVNLTKVPYKDNERHDNLQVFFSLENGLFSYVSGPGTTLVDAFITYEVSCKVEIDGPNPDVALIRTTVQGLMTADQEYKWMQYISYPRFDDDLDPDDIRTEVKIIDFDCEESCKLTIEDIGYERFKKSSKNTAPLSADD